VRLIRKLEKLFQRKPDTAGQKTVGHSYFTISRRGLLHKRTNTSRQQPRKDIRQVHFPDAKTSLNAQSLVCAAFLRHDEAISGDTKSGNRKSRLGT